MNKSISFSFKTEDEKQEFIDYADGKGMTLSALAKMALFQYKAKYPLKRCQTHNKETEARTVQS